MTSHVDHRNDVDVDPEHVLSAQGRLAWAADKLCDRLAELDEEAADRPIGDGTLPAWHGPAVTVTVHGSDVAPLVADDMCRTYLETIADHGRRAGVVVRWVGDAEQISSALAARSGKLAAALAAGKTFQHVQPGSPLEPLKVATFDQPPGDQVESADYRDALSAQVWASLLLADADNLIRIFSQIGVAEASTRAAGQPPAAVRSLLTRRRLLADSLRRAADAVLPGAGGMIRGQRMVCPLCIAEPLFTPEQMPGHLLEVHNGLRPVTV
jgi:hypothetical protein